MTQYYYNLDYQFIFCFPLNGQKGYSLHYGNVRGLDYTLKEVKDIGAKIITKEKAERIIKTKLPD